MPQIISRLRQHSLPLIAAAGKTCASVAQEITQKIPQADWVQVRAENGSEIIYDLKTQEFVVVRPTP